MARTTIPFNDDWRFHAGALSGAEDPEFDDAGWQGVTLPHDWAMDWGNPNLVAVHASTLEHYSRWYPGAGIYRKVTLLLVDPVHVPVWGVRVTTPRIDDDAADVEIETSVAHAGTEPIHVTVRTDILTPDGVCAATMETGDASLPAGQTARIRQSVRLPSPRLWDVDHPDLYTVRTRLLRGEDVLDGVDTRFGVRTIAWTAEDGFHLNGRRVQLQGVCLHHDNGPLGAAEFRDAATRKLRIMMDMGVYAFGHPTSKGDYSPRFTETSYDRTAASWSDIRDVEFMRMERDRYVAGEFVWTGFDYLGEPTPHTDDARSSYFGIVDLAGLPKDRFYLYRSLWNKRDHTVHLLPHWTWPDRVGKNVPVYVYTDGDEAELFLNGRSLGRRTKHGGDADDRVGGLAQNRPTTASSEEIAQDANGNVLRENRADAAVDGSGGSRWCASDGSFPQWWQVDLEQVQPVGYLRIDWERTADAVAYDVQASSDLLTWTSIGGSDVDRTYGGRSVLLPSAEARYIRVLVSNVRGGWASIREVCIETSAPAGGEEQDPYYQVMDRYRLRWEEVTYEPGELKAVCYARGRPIGEAVVTTAGPAAAIRLTPETTGMAANGQSLCYILRNLWAALRRTPNDGEAR